MTSPSATSPSASASTTASATRDARTAARPALPWEFFHPRVVHTRRLSPTLVRITLGSPELARVVSGGRDQRFKLFLPRPGQDVPVLPDVLDERWYAHWRAMDPDVRGVMRTYTIRAVRAEPAELDVDFALHGDLGPASRWARRAAPGDPVSVLAPVAPENGGVDFAPPTDARWVLLAGDETALPAIAGILAWLPAGLPVRAWIEVADPADMAELPTAAHAEVTWLVRPPGTAASPLPDALASAPPFPTTPGYAWIAGEASAVRAMRRHLLTDHAFPRTHITFTGYWRRGTTEDALLTEAATSTG